MSERYSRQELFKDIGAEGQKKISEKTVSIIGVGALGSVSSELLARAGIGRIMIFDADVLEESNLQRQTLYTEKDIGTHKVFAAKKHLEEINSSLKVDAFAERVTSENIDKVKADIIIDGTDNMDTRFLINEYAVKNNIPFVYGSAAGSIGIVYNVLDGKNPCFYCIFKKSHGFATCNTEGIINSATYMVASFQAAEALKIILGKNPSTDLLRFDLWKMTFEKIRVKKFEKCPVCSNEYKMLENKKHEDFRITECKTKSAYTVKPNKKISLDIKKITSAFQAIEDGGIIAVIKADGEEIIVHDYGELLFKTLKDEEKIREIATKIYTAGSS